MKPTRWTTLLIALLSSTLAFAEEPKDSGNGLRKLAQRAGLNGATSMGYWSSSRTLDERASLGVFAVWLKAAPKFGHNSSLLIEGWLRNQDLFRGGKINRALREAYFDVNLGSFDLRVGKQIIVWGRADQINPTDNLTPRDFTLLTPEDSSQRLGTLAVKATRYFRRISLTGAWLPEFNPHTIPLRRPSPVFTFQEQVPRGVLGQWGIKIEETGKAMDWSLSYFDGFDLFPDLGIGRISPSSVDLTGVFNHDAIDPGK